MLGKLGDGRLDQRHIQRLSQVGVHARIQAFAGILGKGVSRQGQDGHCLGIGAIQCTDDAGSGQAPSTLGIITSIRMASYPPGAGRSAFWVDIV